MEPIDAYRCAKLLLNQHGEDASLHAAQRADELEIAGDEDGRRAWIAILAAVDELARTAKSPLERLQ
ncbi:MAG: hypothetical protein M3N05_08630 [Pseudomonadota bacterium]|nr:hypothetical protein [Pseudomonadota bacterium]